MDYRGDIFRPPSEAHSILLQVTTGCSHNRCTFCDMYSQSPFTIKPEATVMADIAFAALHCRRQSRLFLCDGDALIMPQQRILTTLDRIAEQLPWVERVSIYANARSILRKSEAQLVELREHGLALAYLGLESGDDQTLAAVNKGADARAMIQAGQRLRRAGIKLSVTVLLGLAGRERSLEHARATGAVLTAMDPEYVGALSLMLTPGTPLHDDHRKGSFDPPGPLGLLRELGEMIEHTELSSGYFHANHASNYLPIKARLPEDKEATLELIRKAIKGEVSLKHEASRLF
nr:radical SAM protein [Desulfogranum mediterraneum]